MVSGADGLYIREFQSIFQQKSYRGDGSRMKPNPIDFLTPFDFCRPLDELFCGIGLRTGDQASNPFTKSNRYPNAHHANTFTGQ
jgi:hypothetical protein